jgi:hypothetical protein
VSKMINVGSSGKVLTGDSDFEGFEEMYSFGAEGYSTSPPTVTLTYSHNKDVPRNTLIPRALQYMETSALDIRKPFDKFAGFTIATIPTLLSTRVLNLLFIDAASNETTSIELPRPVVAAQCRTITKPKASSPIIYSLDDGGSEGTISRILSNNISFFPIQQIHWSTLYRRYGGLRQSLDLPRTSSTSSLMIAHLPLARNHIRSQPFLITKIKQLALASRA